MRRAAPRAGAVVLLCILVAAVYAPVRGFEFIGLDDQSYVVLNPHVNQGLSADALAWAFRETHTSNWHPLSWISHQIDVELFGLDPGGHHVTNVVLHALAVCLLFLALCAASGSLGRSFAVAALVAAHPLNVEPVAWVAERKTLLCAVFAFAALWGYVGYARRGGWLRLTGVCLAFAASLLAKPMAVTLPFVFLLFDRGPLARLESRADLVARLREKILLFAMTAGSCAVTYLAQESGGAMQGAGAVPLAARLANATVSYARYLGHALWPDALAVYYPHPDLPGGVPWSVLQVLAAAALLVVLTGLALRRRPAAVGALWFLGTAVPMLGIVQVGSQAMADRYFYLPGVGLAIAAVWMLADAGSAHRRVVALGAAVVIAAYAARAHHQVGYWSDSRTLYTHSVRVAPGSPLLTVNLANALRRDGELDAAIVRYREALSHDPGFFSAHHNLGTALRRRGDPVAAAEAFERAVAARPDSAASHYYLGMSLVESGWPERGEPHLRRAHQLRAQDPAAP
jgi:tetratricopeptide (TPR) repeat protein